VTASSPLRPILLGLAYFCAASVAVSLTSYGGGVAFLWFAASFLIADLSSRPRRQWLRSIMPCAVASVMATGLFGLGWAAALPFMVINMIEAGLAAWILRRHGHTLRPLVSLAWLWRFVVAVGVIAPAVSAVLAASAMWALGKPPGPALVNFFAGHALGNITFTPLAMLVAQGVIRKSILKRRRRQNLESVSLLALVLAVSALVFSQSSLPLLFLPILPIILVAFRNGRGGTALAIVLLALCGGAATLAGWGPVQLIAPSMGAQLIFFQFYLAATVLTVLPVAADLQNRSRLNRALRLSEARYRILAEHSTDILIHLELDGRIRYVSPSIRQRAGHDPDALIGRNCNILIAPEHLENVRASHYATIAAAGATRTYDYLGMTADGTKRWFETHSRAVLDDDGVTDGVISVVRDVSKRKELEQRLSSDALTDQLTGLPNRRAYRSEAESRAAEGAASGADCVAVIDLDHFKLINDRHGHNAGDEVLRGFANIARRMVRDRDFLARIGGEEFAIFFPDTSCEQAMAICDRLREEMAVTYLRAGRSLVRVTVSGGVAALGPSGIDDALRVADQALYRAKRSGRDQFEMAA